MTSSTVDARPQSWSDARPEASDETAGRDVRDADVRDTDVRDTAQELVREFAGLLPEQVVLRSVARCRFELMRVGVRDGLLDATAAMARTRLRARASARGLVSL